MSPSFSGVVLAGAQTPAGEGVGGGLEAGQAPGGFDQGGAHAGVTVLRDGTLEPGLASGEFARTQSGVTADLTAIGEALPVTDLAVEQDAGEGAQAARLGRIGRGF